MALTQNFYKEIFDKEKVWMTNLNQNLLNIYYLPELKTFYVEKKETLNHEFKLTGNELIRSYLNALNNIITKIDYFITEGKNEASIDIKELNNLFLLNIITNNVSYVSNQNLNRIEEEKKSLYELRNKVINEGAEDYLDDDFYYDNKKVA